MYVFDIVPGRVNAPVLGPDGEIVIEEDGTARTAEQDSPYEGTLTVRAPTAIERIKYSKDISVKRTADGDADLADDGLEQTLAMIEIAKKHIESVNLKRKDTGFEIKNVDTLEVDADAAQLFTSVAMSVLKGVRLGNGSRPK